MDSKGAFLWREPHPSNSEMQGVCMEGAVAVDSIESYAAYAYDAGMALGHALHSLFEVEQKLSFRSL